MTITIEGLDEIKEILETVAPNHARNLMRATIHGVAGEIAKRARVKAPNIGNLKGAIKTRRLRSTPDKPVSDVVVTQGKKAKYDAYWWRWFEYGTAPRYQKRTGKYAGRIQEQPFIRPSAEEVQSNLEAYIRDQFGKKLEKALARQAKKAKR